jgi:hypothetical protein
MKLKPKESKHWLNQTSMSNGCRALLEEESEEQQQKQVLQTCQNLLKLI